MVSFCMVVLQQAISRDLEGKTMDEYTKEELEKAREIISATVGNCEKAQQKFLEGTPQYTLLQNRIKALNISKSLVAAESLPDRYTKEELIDALRPLSSIISKCEKAQQKHAPGNVYYTRLRNIIRAMHICKALITEQIGKRE